VSRVPDCEKYLELIDAYVDGTLEEPMKSALEAHLNECEDCGSLVKITRMMRDSTETLLIDPPENFTAGVMAKLHSEAKLPVKKREYWRPLTLVAACTALAILAYTGDWFGINPAKDASTQNLGTAPMYSAAAPSSTADSATGGGTGSVEAPATRSFTVPAEGGSDVAGEQKAEAMLKGAGQENASGAGEASMSLMALPPSADQKLKLNYMDEDAPLVKSSDFVRGYGFIATVTMPKATFDAKIKGATLIEGSTYYLAVDSEKFDTVLKDLSTEDLTVSMYTKGVFVIEGKTTDLLIITVE
jgi:anti-sigma factor RsiW